MVKKIQRMKMGEAESKTKILETNCKEDKRGERKKINSKVITYVRVWVRRNVTVEWISFTFTAK